jgi:phosphatidylglycerophosphatase A
VLARLIGTWFGCGYFPWAPGTVGSAAALMLAAGLELWTGRGGGIFLLVALVWLAPAVWAAGRLEASSGRKDPSIVVIDEVVGQWVALAGVASHNWKSWLAAFVLFRALDVWKPAPARQVERLRGGFGIVADDLIAGLYTAGVLYLAGRWHLY